MTDDRGAIVDAALLAAAEPVHRQLRLSCPRLCRTHGGDLAGAVAWRSRWKPTGSPASPSFASSRRPSPAGALLRRPHHGRGVAIEGSGRALIQYMSVRPRTRLRRAGARLRHATQQAQVLLPQQKPITAFHSARSYETHPCRAARPGHGGQRHDRGARRNREEISRRAAATCHQGGERPRHESNARVLDGIELVPTAGLIVDRSDIDIVGS